MMRLMKCIYERGEHVAVRQRLAPPPSGFMVVHYPHTFVHFYARFIPEFSRFYFIKYCLCCLCNKLARH